MLLNVDRALNCFSNRFNALFVFLITICVHWWPHDDHSISYKLDDITPVLVQIAHHAIHIPIDTQRQILIALHPLPRTRLTQCREPRYIGEYHDRFHILCFRHLIILSGSILFLVLIGRRFLLFVDDLLDDEGGDEVAELDKVTELAEVVGFGRDRRRLGGLYSVHFFG